MDVRFDHIALALPRMADATPFLVGVLGGSPAFGADAGVYRFGQWRFANRARLEVLEPIGRDGFLPRFLAARGPGLHHVTFKVPSLREALARATGLGYGVVGYNATVPRWKEAFLHPRDALGIVVQIVESPDEPPRGHWRKPPPMPAGPPPPVRLLGLRLRAHSAARARRQWSALLGGAESIENGVHVFRWTASPLRIAVEIDPASDEGPTRIDVAPPSRAVTGLGEPAPGLGAVFAEAP